MKNVNEILAWHVREQIALEEHLSATIDQQIEAINESEFEDAKILLIEAKQTLQQQFKPLNNLLNELESKHLEELEPRAENGSGMGPLRVKRVTQLSKILRDDYSALNLIAISNTALHAAALAAESHRIASVSLAILKT